MKEGTTKQKKTVRTMQRPQPTLFGRRFRRICGQTDLTVGCIHDFRRSQTVIYILAMPKLSALISELRKISMGFAICDLMIPIRLRKVLNMWNRRREISDGSDLIGKTGSFTLRTILNNFTNMP